MESKFNTQSLAILIPMYNEEKVANSCVEEVIKVLKQLSFPVKLIIVNDGSNDTTEKILLKKRKKYQNYLHIHTHKKNKGYGAALQTGIEIALKQKFTWILHMDSDLTNDPKYIHDFVKYLNSSYDCIKASRYIKGGRVQNVPQYRRIISVVGNYMAHFLFNVGIKDCTNGFRMVRLSTLRFVIFQENNFSIILEELLYLKKKKASFKEIPYVLTARTNSKSHFTYKPQIFIAYFKYALLSLIS